MEDIILDNKYIEGLLVAIKKVKPISEELAEDMTEVLFARLMESNLFAAARIVPEDNDDFSQMDVFAVSTSLGFSCLPVCTNPETLRNFMGEREKLHDDDPPFAILSFSQIYELARSLESEIIGIVLNPETESERIMTLGEMEDVIEGITGMDK